nr:MAG TPA: hypothetical protein [Caudoviricetes sp.]
MCFFKTHYSVLKVPCQYFFVSLRNFLIVIY